MIDAEFNIYEFIETASHYIKFYKEFCLSFNSNEIMETSIKLIIDIDDDEYFGCSLDYDYYNYDKLIRDLGISYEIYEDEKSFEEDYCNNNYIYNLKIKYPEFYKKLKEKGLTDNEICNDGFIQSEKKWDTIELAKKHKLYNFLRKKYVIFDINKLIDYSHKFYPKFYEEFLLKFKNVDEIEKEIKSIVDVEDYRYKYRDRKNNIRINHYQIIRKVAIKYGIYRNQKEMRKDYIG